MHIDDIVVLIVQLGYNSTRLWVCKQQNFFFPRALRLGSLRSRCWQTSAPVRGQFLIFVDDCLVVVPHGEGSGEVLCLLFLFYKGRLISFFEAAPHMTY